MHLSMFSPQNGVGGGIPWGLDSQNSHCPREFDRRLWHRGGTLDVSVRKLMKLCLNLKARHMGRELDNFSKLSNSLG